MVAPVIPINSMRKSNQSIKVEVTPKSTPTKLSPVGLVTKPSAFAKPTVQIKEERNNPLVAITAKGLQENTHYHSPYRTISIDETLAKENADFFMNTIQEGVAELSKKKKKQYKRICQATVAASLALLVLTNPVFAETSIPVVTQTNQDLLLPEDIMKIGLYLIGICAAGSTILAAICIQLAGGYRMLRKGKEATEWTTDILKGYTQVLLGPVTIAIIALVIGLLFAGFDFFVSPF